MILYIVNHVKPNKSTEYIKIIKEKKKRDNYNNLAASRRIAIRWESSTTAASNERRATNGNESHSFRKIPRSWGAKYGDGGSLKVLRISPASLPPFTQIPKPWESGGSLVMVIVLTVSSWRLRGWELGEVGGLAGFGCDCCDCWDCCCCWDVEDGVLLTAATLAGEEAGVLLSPCRRSETPFPKSLTKQKCHFFFLSRKRHSQLSLLYFCRGVLSLLEQLEISMRLLKCRAYLWDILLHVEYRIQLFGRVIDSCFIIKGNF